VDLRSYDPNCRLCPRLATFLDQVKAKHPSYFCKPVPPFGPAKAELMIVGLAPGLHGANASGRPFTGDWCSDLLYGTLYQFGFASKPRSISAADDLTLINCRLTNAVKCLPPENKPTPGEVNQCLGYLRHEITVAIKPRVIVCLGAVAHSAVLKALPLNDYGVKAAHFKFGHGVIHGIGPYTIVDSYHPSRYNTNTGRLTPAMFEAVFATVQGLLNTPLKDPLKTSLVMPAQ
jgi:uracil-DNA glycosylase family 4